jgi:2-oxoglutarate ferredoxin oxidoreductase subunit alpha
LTLWPFPYQQINKAANKFRVFLTVELNCGQMVEDVQLATAGKSPVIFYGRPAGGIPTVEDIVEKIRQLTFDKKHINV